MMATPKSQVAEVVSPQMMTTPKSQVAEVVAPDNVMSKVS